MKDWKLTYYFNTYIEDQLCNFSLIKSVIKIGLDKEVNLSYSMTLLRQNVKIAENVNY